MSGEMVPIIIVPAMLYCIYLVIKIIIDNLTKRNLVAQGLTADEVIKVMRVNSEMSPEVSIRRGIVLVAMGIPLLFHDLFWLDEAILLGSVLVCGGLGFLIHYVIFKKRFTNKES